MISITNIEVWGFEHAIRSMRNPKNSWAKSDSNCSGCMANEDKDNIDCESCNVYIGKNDLDLMKKLCKAGSEHRKFLRQIFLSMDITAPLYWWKEFDTYKVGTVANSCSTMHKIAAKEFELDDFSHEHLNELSVMFVRDTIKHLNVEREYYNNTKDKEAWWQMIQLLPSSYNQKRTVTMNYENVVTIIKQRTGHKLDEWHTFVDTLLSLPYMRELYEATTSKLDDTKQTKTLQVQDAQSTDGTDIVEEWYQKNKNRIFDEWLSMHKLTNPPINAPWVYHPYEYPDPTITSTPPFRPQPYITCDDTCTVTGKMSDETISTSSTSDESL